MTRSHDHHRRRIPWRLLPSREMGWGSPVACWRRLRDWQRVGVWSGRWRGWWAIGACRSATSAAPTESVSTLAGDPSPKRRLGGDWM
jgi:transposase